MQSHVQVGQMSPSQTYQVLHIFDSIFFSFDTNCSNIFFFVTTFAVSLRPVYDVRLIIVKCFLNIITELNDQLRDASFLSILILEV